MAQFTIYQNTDGSAPSVDGTAGSLVALLEACLVAGYGAKAAAGWTRAFPAGPIAGVTKAAFQQGAGSNGMYLRVQDDGPGAGTFKEARITGYETMSDVDTGTNPFPSAAQGVGGVAMVVARKSTALSAVARDWIVFADSRTAYVLIKSEVAVGVAGDYSCFCFGEFYSFQQNDPYRVFISGRISEDSAAPQSDTFVRSDQFVNAQTLGHFMPRGHNGTYGPINLGKTSDQIKNGGLGAGFGSVPYTNPSDGGLYLAPYWVSDGVTAPVQGLRGRLRGLWNFLHPVASVNDRDTVSGGASGELAGKTFIFIKNIGSNAQTTGVGCVETSNTLETN